MYFDAEQIWDKKGSKNHKTSCVWSSGFLSGFAILRAASHSDLGTETVYHAIAVMSLSDGQPVICFCRSAYQEKTSNS